jgi:non-ribosomal peptide synthetase component F
MGFRYRSQRFPPLLQVKLLVRNRFTGSLVYELVVGRWEILVRPLFQDFRGHGCKLCLENETVEQVFETTDAGSQDKNVTITLREHPLNVLHDIHSVLTDVIQAPDERRNVGLDCTPKMRHEIIALRKAWKRRI